MDRKLWLFALACCRRVDHLLTPATVPAALPGEASDHPREALSLAERLLEGDSSAGPWPLDRRFHLPRVVSPAEHALAAACYAVVDLFNEDRREGVAVAVFQRPAIEPPRDYFQYPRVRHDTIVGVRTSYETRLAVARAAAGPPPPSVSPQWHADWMDAERAESAAHARMVRCLFGDPFAPTPAFESGCLAHNGGIASKLAASINAEYAFDRLPILADALEDAGCTDAELLGHLRGPGPHVRGCWALDLITGRT
jgi:hypothetical protein